jgi:hypothetical protein
MSTQKLLESLNAQSKNLDQLIKIMEEQKEAVIKSNSSALENALTSEQKILKNVELEEFTRIKLVREIANHFAIQFEKNSIEDLFKEGNRIFGPRINEFQKVRSSLREKLFYITNMNAQLKDVVDFSRGLIKDTMMMIAGSNKHAFVNKRV